MEQLAAVMRVAAAYLSEDFFPACDEFLDQCRIDLLGRCNYKACAVFHYDLCNLISVEIRVSLVAICAYVTSYKLIHNIDGSDLIPSVRALFEVIKQVAKLIVATKSVEFILNGILSLRHWLDKILVRVDASLNLQFQFIDALRELRSAYKRRHRVELIEVYLESLVISLGSGLASKHSCRQKVLAADDRRLVENGLESRYNALLIEILGTFSKFLVCLLTLLCSGTEFQISLHLAVPIEVIGQSLVVYILLAYQDNHLLVLVLECNLCRYSTGMVNHELNLKVWI